MLTSLASYLLAFALVFWPDVAHHPYQLRDATIDASEIADTDATPAEALRLMNVAALESGFIRSAKGRLGELGAWQIMPPARSYGAAEALRRMRAQGMLGFIGCRSPGARVVLPGGIATTCAEMVAHRTERADLYRMGFDPPNAGADVGDSAVASR